MRTSAVVAAADNDVIGRAGGLPWHLPSDLKWFRALTSGHVVVAGRVTHDSIVQRLGRPLPGRITVVLSSRAPEPAPTVVHAPSPAAALDLAHGLSEWAGRDEVFVIGGAAVYEATVRQVDRVYLTRVHTAADGDVALPPAWLDGFRLVTEEPGTDGPTAFTRQVYERA